MAVIRQQNLIGQMRVDVPHLRSIESSVAADFDVLAGEALCGTSSFIVRGFNVIMTGVIGADANLLKVDTRKGVMLHYNGSENGTLFSTAKTIVNTEQLSSALNTNVTGSWVAGQVNYVGVDFIRSADATTSDLVQVLDANTDSEVPKTIPLARTLNYHFYISTTTFDSNPSLEPVAAVTLDANGKVTAVQDARKLLLRLGSGGSFPNNQNSYAWPQGRLETTDTTQDTFTGADKSLLSVKDWMDATMTTLWEAKGGRYWYSPTADRNVRMVRDPTNVYANNENFNWIASSSTLQWKGISFLFDNSNDASQATPDINVNDIVAGSSVLADGSCVYVDIDRSQNRTIGGGNALSALVGPISQLGSPTIPGSRFIIAWRYGSAVMTRDFPYAAGTTFTPASTTGLGVVRLSGTVTDTASPQTAAIDGSNRAMAAGLTRAGAVADDGATSLGAGALSIGTTSSDTSIVLGSTSATSITLGSAQVTVGTSAVATYIDANTATLSIGTNSATTGLTMGRVGVATVIEGLTTTIGTNASSGNVTLGNSTSTVLINYILDTALMDHTGSIAIGGTHATNVQVGYNTNGGLTSILGTNINIDTGTGAGALNIISNGNGGLYIDAGSGALGSGTAGVAAIAIGLTATNGTTIGSNTSGALALNSGSTVSIDSNGSTVSIGTPNATTVNIGRIGQNTRTRGTLIAEGDVYIDNGTGAASLNNKLSAPAFAYSAGATGTYTVATVSPIYQPIPWGSTLGLPARNITTGGGSVASGAGGVGAAGGGTPTFTVGGAGWTPGAFQYYYLKDSANNYFFIINNSATVLTLQTGGPVPANGNWTIYSPSFISVPAGVYQINVAGTYYVNGVAGGATTLYAYTLFNGGTGGTNSAAKIMALTPSASNQFAFNSIVDLSLPNTIDVVFSVDVGTVQFDMTFLQMTITRIGPHS